MSTGGIIAMVCGAVAYCVMLGAMGWCVFAPQSDWGDRVNGIIGSLTLIALGALVLL